MQARLESPPAWERVSKMLVVLSVLAAALVQHGLWITRADLPAWIALDVVILAVILVARRRPAAALAAVLVLFTVVHGRLLTAVGFASFSQVQPQMMALLGVVLARPDLRRWHLPERWKGPLILWGLVVALSWPIIFMRELDFVPGLTLAGPTVNNKYGVRAIEAAGWVVRTALVQGVGFLWIDWLFQTYTARRKKFARLVAWPFAIGLLFSFAVAIYQGFVDIGFLNAEPWISVGRATGLLLDGNHLGILAALWGPLLFLMVWESGGTGSEHPGAGHRRGATILAHLVLGVAWLSVLISGSTSSVFIMMPALVGLAWLVGRNRRAAGGAGQIGSVWPAVAGLFLVFVLGLVLSLAAAETSVRRLVGQIPRPGVRSAETVVSAQLRDRPFFARLGLTMVADWPLTGTGIGSFNTLANDVAVAHGMTEWVEFENALNWYIHQLAELGLIGSLGWVGWVIVFSTMLLRNRAGPGSASRRALLRVLLIGFGVASLFGVHTQSPGVLLSFWMFVFWLAISSSRSREGEPEVRGRARSSWSGPGILVVSGIYVVALSAASFSTLRVTERAAMADWTYEYGFHGWEKAAGLGDYRWTRRSAVAVIPVEEPWLHLVLDAFRPDLADDPVTVRVWIEGRLAAEIRLEGPGKVERFLRLPAGHKRARVELDVSRTWRPSERGARDNRELGVAVARWRYLPAPPPRSRASPLDSLLR